MASGTDLACCPDTDIAQCVHMCLKKGGTGWSLVYCCLGGPEGAVQQRAPVGGGVIACFAVPLNCRVLLHGEKDS